MANKILIILAWLLLLASCITKKRCKELCTTDTLIVNVVDTVRIADVKHDTIVNIKFDSVIIKKDKLHIKLIKVADSIVIQGKCLADTIYINKQIKMPVKQYKPTFIERLKSSRNYIAWAFLIGFALGLFVQLKRQ